MTEFDLRLAVISDAERLFEWSNDPASLAVALRTNRPIAWAEHIQWFHDRLVDQDSRIWIADLDAISVGTVRVQLTNGVRAVSV